RSPPLRAPDRRQINARPACITPHLFLFLLYLSLSPRRPKSARASLPAPLFAHLPSIRHPSLPAGRKIKIKRKEKDPPVPSSFETAFIPLPRPWTSCCSSSSSCSRPFWGSSSSPRFLRNCT